MITPYLFLILAFLSIFIRRDRLIWGPLLIISLASALYLHIISWVGLIAIGILFLLYLNYVKTGKWQGKALFALSILLLSLALGMHQVSGFHNLLIAEDIQLTSDAIPYSMYFNYDKPFIGLAPLIFCIPLLRFSSKRILPTLIWTLVTMIVLLGTSELLGVIHWEPKIPSFFITWTVANLFFVSLPEEAFFRGFIQRELSQRLGSFWGIALTACGFGMIHLWVIPNLKYALLCVLAGIGYGWVYERTKSIVSAVFCHFSVNFAHFFLFTYPLLAN